MSEIRWWPTEFSRVPNRILALRLIREEGPLSRADIARRLKLSRPTASRIVDDLVREGLITITGKSSPTGGRLGDLYTFRSDAGFVVGLSLATRRARLAIATLSGEIIHYTSRALSLETRDTVLPQIHRLVTDGLGQAAVISTNVRSIGVAVPGVVHAKPAIVDSATIFTGLNDRPLRTELEQLFGVPVTMDNDVNFAAIGERQSGCARGHDHVVYLFVGRGIGAGLVLDGHLFRGSKEAAGEVGNMLIDRVNLHTRRGTRGFLEATAGIDQLVSAAASLGIANASPETVCNEAFSGHPRALEAIGAMNEYLAAAIINLTAVLDPEIIVLGGDLAELPYAEELFLRPIERLIEQHSGHTPPLRLSQLHADAPLYGAVQAALNAALAAASRFETRSTNGADDTASADEEAVLVSAPYSG